MNLDEVKRIADSLPPPPEHEGRQEVHVSHALFDNLRDQAEPSTELWRYSLDGITVRAVDDLPAGLGHRIVWPDCSCRSCLAERAMRATLRDDLARG